MSDKFLMKLGGWVMVASGVANFGFWAMVWKIGSFVGASAALDPAWAPAQWLHVIGAALGTLGLVALFGALRARLGVIGLVSFITALVGAMCYFTDGVIALAVYPALARQAPGLLAVTGAMNVPPVLLAFIAFSAIAMTGLVALSAAFLRLRAFPAGSLVLFAVGAVLSNLPPGPAPVQVIQIGGLVFGLGATWIGLAAAFKGSPSGVAVADAALSA